MPLYGGKSVIEVLAIALGDGPTEGYKIVRQTFEEPKSGTDEFIAFESKFREALEAGFFKRPPGVVVDASFKFAQFTVPDAPPAAPPTTFTLRFEADSHTYDGRFANNGWLQETPDPLTKLMWENALLMSVKDARSSSLNLEQGDIVELTLADGSKLKAPVCLQPGQPSGIVSLSLGYGRTAAGHIGDNLGVNAYSIRTAVNPWIRAGRPNQVDRRTLPASPAHRRAPSAQFNGDRQAEEYRIGKKNEKRKDHPRNVTLAEYRQGSGRSWRQASQGWPSAFRPTHEATISATCMHGACQSTWHCVHRLQRLRGCLPGREQHSDRRQGTMPASSRDELDSH